MSYKIKHKSINVNRPNYKLMILTFIDFIPQ